MTMYEKVAASTDGKRRLAAGRLRHEVLKVMHAALDASNKTQSELADALSVGKSAVSQVFRGDGNVRVNTLAEYLHELGYELALEIRPAGEARRAAQTFAPKFDFTWTPASEISVDKKFASAMDSTRSDFARAA